MKKKYSRKKRKKKYPTKKCGGGDETAAETDLDNEIQQLRGQIASLGRQLRQKERQKAKIIEERRQEIEERRQKERREQKIKEKAALRLKIGTKSFNKPCSQTDYEQGKMLDGFKCSKASDGFRYRAIGNPGDKHFSNEDVVEGAGFSYLKDYPGVASLVPLERFVTEDIDKMRAEQISEHEKNIAKGVADEVFKPEGVAQRFAGRAMRPIVMRDAEEAAAEARAEEKKYNLSKGSFQ